MVRRHGWQLPAHSFQVVAITVFFLLAVAFYVFLAPFLWIRPLEISAFALYSPLAFAVFLLYVRSSAIDPADPGVLSSQPELRQSRKASVVGHSGGLIQGETITSFSPEFSNLSRSSSIAPGDSNLDPPGPYIEPYIEPAREGWPRIECMKSLSAVCGCFCGWVTADDSCCDVFTLQQPVSDEDILFCTLCKAEVRKFSKHCRSCDKCVDGFDHHCRWLNNCVGKKNYKTFVVLMASSLSLLILEWGIGIAVFVRCFVDKDGIEHQIVNNLGNSFSRAPFATVVAICTFVSLLASIPLGELFFFHLILIRKGITTYDYVVAMRAQNEPHGFSIEGDARSIPATPSSSSTAGMSAASSLGVQYTQGGAWCTPPRVFVEQQDEVMSHLGPGQLPSTVDPDGGIPGSLLPDNRRKKGTVRISPWKLSKLNVNEVARASAQARENSSVLRNFGPTDFKQTPRGYTSTSNLSSQSSLSADQLNVRQGPRNISLGHDLLTNHPITDESSVQEEEHFQGDGSQVWSGAAGSSDGYEASSGGESAESGRYPWANQFASRGPILPDHRTLPLKEAKKRPFFWGRSSGKFGSELTSRVEVDEENKGPWNYPIGSRWGMTDVLNSPLALLDENPSEYASERISLSQASPPATHETGGRFSILSVNPSNLVYSGPSIFYGGPIAGPPTTPREDIEAVPPRNPTTSNAILAMPRASREGEIQPVSSVYQAPGFVSRSRPSTLGQIRPP